MFAKLQIYVCSTSTSPVVYRLFHVYLSKKSFSVGCHLDSAAIFDVSCQVFTAVVAFMVVFVAEGGIAPFFRVN
jgi:hypothetical protein